MLEEIDFVMANNNHRSTCFIDGFRLHGAQVLWSNLFLDVPLTSHMYPRIPLKSPVSSLHNKLSSTHGISW